MAKKPRRVASKRQGTPKRPSDLAGLQRIGEAFRAIRVDQGVSQEELASRAGLDRTYVSAFERGQRNCTFVSMLRIAEALRIEDPKILLSDLVRDAGF